jgi:two-component system response regulator DesR
MEQEEIIAVARESKTDMNTTEIRVLLAEDYQPFRQFLAATIQKWPQPTVMREVGNGAEAVTMAVEFQPDLALLDIGLPGLNGIEVARRIRSLCPTCKILFVSQELSADVVEAALETGAFGYVSKTDAGRELTDAMDSVVRGQRYLSRNIVAGHSTACEASSPATTKEHSDEVQLDGPTRHHELGVYSDDGALLHGFTNFIGAAIRNGNAAIVIATEAHRNELVAALGLRGLDIQTAIRQGRYIAFDTAEVLSEIMVNNLPDPNRFSRVIDELITRAAKSVNGERSHVVSCGEGASYLWAQGNAEGALRWERLCDGLAKTYGIHILCGYPVLEDPTGNSNFEKICMEHSAVISL